MKEYFSHDYHARTDRKMVNLQMKYGIFCVNRIGSVPAGFPFSALIKSAKLFKTDTKRIGVFGRSEYAYKIINRL